MYMVALLFNVIKLQIPFIYVALHSGGKLKYKQDHFFHTNSVFEFNQVRFELYIALLFSSEMTIAHLPCVSSIETPATRINCWILWVGKPL